MCTKSRILFFFLFKAKYFEDEPELTFDEIIEQVQGTDLPVDTKEWLREVALLCLLLLYSEISLIFLLYYRGFK